MIGNEYHGKNDQSGNKDVGYEKEIFPAGKGISCRSPEMNRTRGFYMPNDKKAVYKKHMVMGRE